MKSACVLLLFVVAACALPLEEIALDINPVQDAVVANVEEQIGTELNDVIRDKRQFGGYGGYGGGYNQGYGGYGGGHGGYGGYGGGGYGGGHGGYGGYGGGGYGGGHHHGHHHHHHGR